MIFLQVLTELERYVDFNGASPAVVTIGAVLRKAGFKQYITHPVKALWNLPHIVAHRTGWVSRLDETRVCWSRAIFYDEQPFSFVAHRPMGRSEVGRRVTCPVPEPGLGLTLALALAGNGKVHHDVWTKGTTAEKHIKPFLEAAFRTFRIGRRGRAPDGTPAPLTEHHWWLVLDTASSHHAQVCHQRQFWCMLWPHLCLFCLCRC